MNDDSLSLMAELEALEEELRIAVNPLYGCNRRFPDLTADQIASRIIDIQRTLAARRGEHIG